MKLTELLNSLARGRTWLPFCFALALGAAAPPAQAEDWFPSQRLLDTVRHIESADGRMLVGDHGRSLGAYQLSKGAWLDVDAWRKARGRATLEYQASVWSETDSRSYAADYLSILHLRLTKFLRRAPNSAELYAAYNMGFACFARCQCSLANVNPVTAAKCRQIETLMRAQLSQNGPHALAQPGRTHFT